MICPLNDAFRKARRSAGFSLLELLIVVGVIGILSAVGLPLYSGYIQSSKESAAQNALRSIYLMEQDFYGEYSRYCTSSSSPEKCGSTQQINQYLFGGNKTLNESGEYSFVVAPYGTGFRASAQPANPAWASLCIDNNNASC